MAEQRVVGIATPRVEGEEKVSGRAVYAVDVVLPGMLWVKALRSPVAYGRIKRIDIHRAQELPGVRAVITGKDIAGVKVGKKIVDMPVLADQVVRFIGEKVAAVAAESEDSAEKALDLIEVEYEELEPVFDPVEAMKPSAPLLHPDLLQYAGLPHKLEKPSNVAVQLSWKKGDVEEGFGRSDVVLENTFYTPLAHHAYIESHACVVKATADGGAEIWASSKSPFSVRDQLARAFQLEAKKLVLHPCYIGGDFGGKGDSNDVALCYALSRKSGRPVKMVTDYDEEFIAGNPRHAAIVRVKTGVKKNGTIMAQHIHFIFDSGAYAGLRPQGFLVGAHDAAGPYRIPNVFIEEHYVYTNKVPCGYLRAPGHVQGHFAAESQMDLVAKRIGLDPIRLREINFMQDGDESPTGEMVAHIKTQETLQMALQKSGYHGSKRNNAGRGCAVAQWLSKGGEAYAFVRITPDGAISVLSAVMDVGPGAHTLLRQIVAEELKVSPEKVQVERLDTTQVPTDTGVRGSSSTRVHGGAAYEAAKAAREEIVKIAAQCMGAGPDQLILHGGGVIHGRAERRMTFAEIVKAKGSPIIAEGHYSNMKDGPEASVVAQIAEVEVDAETGEVKLRQLTTAHHTGTVLNPVAHQGQIEGGLVMGIGYATMEEMLVDDGGKVASANFGDYKIPTIADIPPLKTAVIESGMGSGPYRSMSIGETAIMPTAAAIANAVEDAVGVRINSLPITAEKVLQALKNR